MTKSISIFSDSCEKWRELKNYNTFQLELNFIFDATLQEKEKEK